MRLLESFPNPSFPSAASHVLYFAYMTGAFVIAGVAAFSVTGRVRR